MSQGFHEYTADLFNFDEVVDVPKGAPSYLKDHRQRLRERFRNGGADAVLDYELLELLLFRAIPRQDVKPLARRLIDHFGDLAIAQVPEMDCRLGIGGNDALCTGEIGIRTTAHDGKLSIFCACLPP